MILGRRTVLAAGAGLVCIVSWLALAIGAGNVGLQRSISMGAVSLFEEPAALLLVALAAFGSAFLLTRAWRLRPAGLLVGVLIGDAFAGVVLAPIAIGELEPIDAPLVFAAVTVLGIQPVAALLGAWLATRRSGASSVVSPSP